MSESESTLAGVTEPRPLVSAVANDPGSGEVQVVIGLLTYRRNSCLEQLLPVLIDQCAPLGATILVIDNDPAGGAEESVQRWAGQGVNYIHEPRPGIAAARNRALDDAKGDLLVFIDDDELPLDRWLTELVDSWRIWRCAAVTGPVETIFEASVDPWILACGVLKPMKFKTGTEVRGAATNNLLLDLAQITALALRFDERFGLTGGEDTMLSHTLVRRGGSIRWCEEARVIDRISPLRTNRRWMLLRTFRSGTTWSRVAVLLSGSGWRRLLERADLSVRALYRIASGTARFGRGMVRRDLGDRASGICAAAAGLGMLLGAFGYIHQEYGRKSLRQPGWRRLNRKAQH